MGAVDKARSEIARRIARGEWAPGATLPSEAELCSQFEVSRSSLREAQKMLAMAGVLTLQPSRGTAVAEMGPRDIMSGLELVVPLLPLERYLALFGMREAVEGQAAALAAARRTDEEAAGLREVAVALAHASGDEAQQLDSRFHELVANASGDPVGAAFLAALRRRGQAYRILELPGGGAEMKRISDAAHLAIVEAIEHREPEGARATMMHHIRTTRSWLESLSPAPE